MLFNLSSATLSHTSFGYVCCLDCSDCMTGVCICSNSPYIKYVQFFVYQSYFNMLLKIDNLIYLNKNHQVHVHCFTIQGAPYFLAALSNIVSKTLLQTLLILYCFLPYWSAFAAAAAAAVFSTGNDCPKTPSGSNDISCMKIYFIHICIY